ncbi:hypothetical protein [uncultured Clostridium sp.]|uniref:hypothetical protein n=1 Tax=uncultured Clostridium sp. TaxID=59620 RepID=UPI0025E99798|nr:hypothetical protein [uncultured Clostridium sp.]
MKLSDAVEIAKECGLTTYGEAIMNVRIHAMNIFNYDEIEDELNELVKEFNESGKDIDDEF